MLGAFFLLGVVIGSLTLARLGDVYGRKPIFILGLLIQLASTIGILLVKNWIVCIFLLLAFGVALSGSRFVGYSYLIELMPTHKQVLVGTLEFLFEAAAYLFICVYFFTISKRW